MRFLSQGDVDIKNDDSWVGDPPILGNCNDGGIHMNGDALKFHGSAVKHAHSSWDGAGVPLSSSISRFEHGSAALAPLLQMFARHQDRVQKSQVNIEERNDN